MAQIAALTAERDAAQEAHQDAAAAHDRMATELRGVRATWEDERERWTADKRTFLAEVCMRGVGLSLSWSRCE